MGAPTRILTLRLLPDLSGFGPAISIAKFDFSSVQTDNVMSCGETSDPPKKGYKKYPSIEHPSGYLLVFLFEYLRLY
jgi:hypothetical protein